MSIINPDSRSVDEVLTDLKVANDPNRDRPTLEMLKLSPASLCVAFFFLSTVVSGCAAGSRASSKSAFPPQCQNTASSTDIFVAFSATNENEKKTVTQVTNSIARTEGRQITIDQIGDELHTIYSNKLDRQILQRLVKATSPVPVADVGLVAAFDRVRTLAAQSPKGLIGYVVTPGSSDPKTLAEIRRAATSLKPYQCFQLKVIGVDSIHRLKLAESLHPIADKLRFASSDRQEWQQLID
jgi:hypothetical protein